MSKYKSEDYKISDVNYYLDNDVSMDYVCNIFNCKKQFLSRWSPSSHQSGFERVDSRPILPNKYLVTYIYVNKIFIFCFSILGSRI